jgi:translation initiation factor IF-1
VDSDGERSAGSPPALATAGGVVSALLPSGLYRVRLDEGSQIVAHIADRIERNFIRLLVGDRVRVELSRVDGRRGRVVEKVG